MDRCEISEYVSKRLYTECKNARKEWSRGDGVGTRYTFVDDLLPEDVCKKIYQSIAPLYKNTRRVETFRERKSTLANVESANAIVEEVVYAFQRNDVLEAISAITCIDGLEADPSLYAGGVSMMGEGDYLCPHIDNSHDGNRQKYRRLNILYYVSPNWNEADGGSLELWDAKVEKNVKIEAKFNRVVIMETHPKSWHSVDPILKDRVRCCVSNYYFSPDPPIVDAAPYYHVTSFNGWPNQKLRRFFCPLDNVLRQFVSGALRFRRRNQLINSSHTNRHI